MIFWFVKIKKSVQKKIGIKQVQFGNGDNIINEKKYPWSLDKGCFKKKSFAVCCDIITIANLMIQTSIRVLLPYYKYKNVKIKYTLLTEMLIKRCIFF